jgi:hypothetical protein
MHDDEIGRCPEETEVSFRADILVAARILAKRVGINPDCAVGIEERARNFV